MKKEIFRGMGTALVTPMNERGIDYDAFGRLIDFQLENGIDAFIVCATTGEAPTLSDEEHIEAVKFVAGRVNGKIPVIAGTGSNYTDHAVEMTKKAKDAGADAALCVTPYYNKCTQRGLIESFYKIADEGGLPVIVYNVPSRTSVNIQPATYKVLAEHDNIVGIKEANGDISAVAETMALCGDRIALYSGNDDQIVPIMSLGGIGCISVFSNIMPKEAKEITDKFFAGDIKGSAALQLRYKALMDALFCEVSPVPVKTALCAMGICSDYVRLPLTKMGDANREKLLSLMRAEGLDV